MELCVFAVDDGYPEAICKGYRSNFLKREDYEQLRACKNMEQIINVHGIPEFIYFTGTSRDRLLV